MSWSTKLTRLTGLDYFSGGKNLSSPHPTRGLGSIVDGLITKANDLIDTLTDGTEDIRVDRHQCDTLEVGFNVPGYGASESWLLVDGVEPPEVSRLIMTDTITTNRTYLQISGGVVSAVLVP